MTVSNKPYLLFIFQYSKVRIFVSLWHQLFCKLLKYIYLTQLTALAGKVPSHLHIDSSSLGRTFSPNRLPSEGDNGDALCDVGLVLFLQPF